MELGPRTSTAWANIVTTRIPACQLANLPTCQLVYSINAMARVGGKQEANKKPSTRVSTMNPQNELLQYPDGVAQG